MQNQDLDSVVNVLERNGLALIHDFVFLGRDDLGEMVSSVARLSTNEDNFEIAVKRGAVKKLFMTVKPVNGVKNAIPYPQYFLIKPADINIRYALEDLTSDVVAQLTDKVSRIIYAKEIRRSYLKDSEKDHYFVRSDIRWLTGFDTPFLVAGYFLQKPNEEYSRCIAPIDPDVAEKIGKDILGYHKEQKIEGHECIILEDGALGFPLIPISDITALKNKGFSLVLNFEFNGVKKARIDELLAEIPLTINTNISTSREKMTPYEVSLGVYLDMYDINRPFNEDGNGRFRLGHEFGYWTPFDYIPKVLSKLLPPFLRAYEDFKK